MSNDERLLSAFERAVLEKLLDGNHPVLSALRAQLDSCEVTNREFTGVGFFTNLKVIDPSMPLRPRVHGSKCGVLVAR